MGNLLSSPSTDAAYGRGKEETRDASSSASELPIFPRISDDKDNGGRRSPVYCRYSFYHPTVVGGRRPLPPLMGDRSGPPPSKIAHVDRFPPVTSQQQELAKKIGSRIRAFQRAIDEVRTLPLSLPKGGSKSELFFFGIKVNFN